MTGMFDGSIDIPGDHCRHRKPVEWLREKADQPGIFTFHSVRRLDPNILNFAESEIVPTLNYVYI
jgi:hypothetical protein